MPLMSWQTFYMWKYRFSSNSYSTSEFQSIPEICFWLGLAMAVFTFFQFWFFISSKKLHGHFLGNMCYFLVYMVHHSCFYDSAKSACFEKIFFSSYIRKCSQPMKLRNFLSFNITKTI